MAYLGWGFVRGVAALVIDVFVAYCGLLVELFNCF